MAENKTRPTGAAVDDFLASVADPQRRADAQAMRDLMERASGEGAAMWGALDRRLRQLSLQV
jgi:hypothetical protein